MMQSFIEYCCPHQSIEPIQAQMTDTYTVGLVAQCYINRWLFHCDCFFTLIGLGAFLTLGDGGAAGGMGFILGGRGGCGGVGATPGFPGRPFSPPPGNFAESAILVLLVALVITL